jgi:hypothetical protein
MRETYLDIGSFSPFLDPRELFSCIRDATGPLPLSLFPLLQILRYPCPYISRRNRSGPNGRALFIALVFRVFVLRSLPSDIGCPSGHCEGVLFLN